MRSVRLGADLVRLLSRRNEVVMILVTGASGLLGASLLSRAQQTARKAAGTSRTNEVRVSGIHVQPLELTDPSATRQFIFERHPSTIIHCAAATDVDWL
jgi:dTDP-4-dehydrorhamnose reductase